MTPEILHEYCSRYQISPDGHDHRPKIQLTKVFK